jgi:Uma2 family endonuclease
MSPQKVYHSIFQGEIESRLRKLTSAGRAFPECAIATDKGTKVADVVWVSDERLDIIINEVECSIAPEIYIEIFSSSNTEKEIQEKKVLYFNRGAEEFWLCNEKGSIRFFDKNGPVSSSDLVPKFPHQINL